MEVTGGVGEEGDEVADADHVDAAGKAVAVVHQRCQRHVATVGATHRHHAAAVEVGLQADPYQQRADIAHGVLAQAAVIQPQEGAAIAG